MLFRVEHEKSSCVHTNFSMTKRKKGPRRRRCNRHTGSYGNNYGNKYANNYGKYGSSRRDRGNGYGAKGKGYGRMKKSNLYKSNSLYGSQMMKTMTVEDGMYSKGFTKGLKKSGYNSTSDLRDGDQRMVSSKKKRKKTKPTRSGFGRFGTYAQVSPYSKDLF